MAATANFWDVQTANHSLIAKAYAQKLSHGIDNNKNQLMPTQSYGYSKVSIKRPVLLNNLVWIFPKSLY